MTMKLTLIPIAALLVAAVPAGSAVAEDAVPAGSAAAEDAVPAAMRRETTSFGGSEGFPFRFALAHGLRNANAENPGDGAATFDAHFQQMGWPLPDKFPSSEAGMKKLTDELKNYNVVILASLFNWDGVDMAQYGPAFRAWIEGGGTFIVNDALYGCAVGWLGSIDPGLAIGWNNGCENQTPTLPLHPIMTFPNDLSRGFASWGHNEVPEGSLYEIINACGGPSVPGGPPKRNCTAAVARLGKGFVFVTAADFGGRWSDAKPIENILCFLRSEGQVAIDLTQHPLVPRFIPGKRGRYKLPAVSNRTDKVVNVCFDYTVDCPPTPPRHYTCRGSIPAFKAVEPELRADIPMRGDARVSLAFRVNGRPVINRGRNYELQPLFRVLGPRYRSYVAADGKTPYEYGVEIYPYDENARLLSFELSVHDEGGRRLGSATFPARKFYDRVPIAIDTASLKAGETLLLKGTLKHRGVRCATSSARMPVVCEADSVVIKDDLSFQVHGKPFFPLGVYHCFPGDYPRLSPLGVNAVQAFTWYYTEPILDGTRENDLMFIIELHPQHNFVERIRSGWLQGQFAGSPNMLSWYVADEPGFEMDEPIRLYQAYRDSDRKHPAWLVSCHVDAFELNGQGCDFLGVDLYPIARDGRHTDIGSVGDSVSKALDAMRGDKPVVFVQQAFGHEPENLMLNLSYQAVVHGASGIYWYAWDELDGKTGIAFSSDTESIIKRTCGELRALEPFLLNRRSHRLLVNGALHARVGTGTDGRRYLLAVNTGDTSVSVPVKLPEFGNALKVADRFGDGFIPVVGGTIRVELPPWGYRVFSW